MWRGHPPLDDAGRHRDVQPGQGVDLRPKDDKFALAGDTDRCGHRGATASGENPLRVSAWCCPVETGDHSPSALRWWLAAGLAAARRA
jgi:hypothetical protein